MSKTKVDKGEVPLSSGKTDIKSDEARTSNEMDNRIAETTKKLIENGFSVINFHQANDVAKWFAGVFKAPMIVGIGGSVSVHSLGIPAMLKAMQIEVLDHATAANKEEARKIQRAIFDADAYLCSANAITAKGEIFNVDAAGNRVAAMNFGPKNVYLVVGKNKIVDNIDEAYKRVRNVVAPQNCERLHLPNPCVETGHCMECNSDTRICNTYSIIRRQPWGNHITIMLVDEDMGF